MPDDTAQPPTFEDLADRISSAPSFLKESKREMEQRIEDLDNDVVVAELTTYAAAERGQDRVVTAAALLAGFSISALLGSKADFSLEWTRVLFIFSLLSAAICNVYSVLMLVLNQYLAARIQRTLSSSSASADSDINKDQLRFLKSTRLHRASAFLSFLAGVVSFLLALTLVSFAHLPDGAAVPASAFVLVASATMGRMAYLQVIAMPAASAISPDRVEEGNTSNSEYRKLSEMKLEA